MHRRHLTAVILLLGVLDALAAENAGKPGQPVSRPGEYHSTLSQIYLRHGDYPKALEHLQKAAELARKPGAPAPARTDDLEFLLELAECCLKYDERDEAVKRLDEALPLAKTGDRSPEILARLSEALNAAGKPKEAAEVAARVFGGIPDPAARAKRFLEMLEQSLKTGGKTTPDLIAAMFGSLKTPAERHDLALKLLYYHPPLRDKQTELKLAILGIKAPSPGIRLLQAEVYLREGGTATAATLYEELHQKSPDDPLLLQRLFVACQAANDPDRALKYGRLLLKKPDDKSRYLAPAVARLMLQNGETEQALKTVREAYKARPDDPMVAYQAALILVDAGQADEGFEMAMTASESGRVSAATAVPFAELMIKAGKVDEAMALLREQRPFPAPAATMMAGRAVDLCLQHKRPDDARAVCANAVAAARSDGDRIALYTSASESAAKYKDWTTAVWFAEQILKLPEVGESHQDAIRMIEGIQKKKDAGKGKE